MIRRRIVRTTYVPCHDSSSRTISRAARIAMLATVFLACTFAVTVTSGGTAAAQPLQPQGKHCVEVWGVDGVALWRLCSGVYIDDVRDLERDAKPTAVRSRANQQNNSEWTYWSGHPGFVIETSTSIMRWVASPIHEGFTHP
jgi:hypothetical protein